MLVWNVTGFKVEASAAGKAYYFEPFEEKKVWNDEHAQHLGKSFEGSGIVVLDYDESAKVSHSTYADYRSAKEVGALRKVLTRYETALSDEKQYVRDVAKNGGSESDKSFANVSEFEEKVKLIKSWLKEAGAESTEKKASSIPKRPSWRKLNDPDTTTDKG